MTIIKIVYFFLMMTFAILTLTRVLLSLWFFYLHKRLRPAHLPSEQDITLLQPILSGDITLEYNLRTNLQLHPQAHFIWLIDKSDIQALRIANNILKEHPRNQCDIIETPEVSNGLNPKTFKLAIGLAACKTTYVGILDDDTILPALGLAKAIAKCKADTLVTGLPFYTIRKNVWSSLLTAFVNSNALLTYPVLGAITPPTTINGMFYVLRKHDLEKRGGFVRIQDKLCDDYAIACLYRTTGGHIVQSDITHPVATTVNHFQHYFSLARRWMIFANRFIQENLSPWVIVFVVIPSLLPLLLLITSLFFNLRMIGLTILILLSKALMTAALRIKIVATKEQIHYVCMEVIADLLLPFMFISACYWPNQFSWRQRKIKMIDERITYE